MERGIWLDSAVLQWLAREAVAIRICPGRFPEMPVVSASAQRQP
jgi:hypothetical protein